jgi:ribosomal protein S18 acetylase RimI-like enzyme
LDEVVGFYRDGLGLPELARFEGHAGYSGVILGLPAADHHLEFTQHERGSPGPAPTLDNLLVLYLGETAAVEHAATRLAALGYPPVAAENPYWTEHRAVTVADPDGWRVVLMPRAGFQDPAGEADVAIDWHVGDRTPLRPLFALAEDSASELESYFRAGRVLVARSGGDVVGHLQLVAVDEPGYVEIKNMAVREDLHGRGIGRRLVRTALARLAAENVSAAANVESVSTVRVATASADIGNLRFYQRLGFRMRSVERDAFTEAAGYDPHTDADGIALRDRVWLDLNLASDS